MDYWTKVWLASIIGALVGTVAGLLLASTVLNFWEWWPW